MEKRGHEEPSKTDKKTEIKKKLLFFTYEERKKRINLKLSKDLEMINQLSEEEFEFEYITRKVTYENIKLNTSIISVGTISSLFLTLCGMVPGLIKHIEKVSNTSKANFNAFGEYFFTGVGITFSITLVALLAFVFVILIFLKVIKSSYINFLMIDSEKEKRLQQEVKTS